MSLLIILIMLLSASGEQNKHRVRSGLLSIHGETEFLDPMTNCSGVVSSGMLDVAHDGPIVVCHIGGCVSANQTELTKTRFHGPITVTFGNCSFNLLSESLCLQSHPLDSLCNSAVYIPHVIMWVISVVNLLITYLVARFVYVRWYYRLSGYKLVSGMGTAFNFHNKYKAVHANSLFSYDKEADKMNVGVSYKTVHFTPRASLLAIAFFMRPVDAIYFRTMHLSVLEAVNTAGFSFMATEGFQSFPLHEDYQTTDWKVSMDYDWHCFTSQCDSHGLCNSYGPEGSFYGNLTRVQSDKWRQARRFCKWGTEGCALGIGCTKWVLNYEIDHTKLSTVYSLGQDTVVLSAVSNSSSAASMVTYELNSLYTPGKISIVRHHTGLWFACPLDSNKLSARSGMLGDIQVTRGMKSSIARDSASCQLSPTTYPSCAIQDSFHRNVPSICERLPASIGSYKFSMEHGCLKVERESNIRLVVESLTPLIVSNASCNIIRKEAWGVRNGLLPYKLVVVASVSTPGSAIKFRMPCSSLEEVVQCDGTPHYYEITSPELCNFEKTGVELHEVQSEDADYLHHSSEMGADSWDLKSFWNTFTKKIFLGSLGGSSTLLVVCSLVILMKI